MCKANLLFELFIPLVIFNGHVIAQEPTRVSDSIPEGVEVIYDVPYTTNQTRDLLLDIYKPANRSTEKIPVIIVIKGGGWVNGNKEGYRHIASAIALRGFTAICVEYRGSDEATFPAALLYRFYNDMSHSFAFPILGTVCSDCFIIVLSALSPESSPGQAIANFKICYAAF